MNERPQPTRKQRARLRECAGMAYERALARELEHLAIAFDKWRSGEVDPFELEKQIHQFHQGPARNLHAHYGSTDVGWIVADAIVTDVLSEQEVEPNLRATIQHLLDFLRGQSPEGAALHAEGDTEREEPAARPSTP